MKLDELFYGEGHLVQFCCPLVHSQHDSGHLAEDCGAHQGWKTSETRAFLQHGRGAENFVLPRTAKLHVHYFLLDDSMVIYVNSIHTHIRPTWR